jgi:hypothetical protein
LVAVVVVMDLEDLEVGLQLVRQEHRPVVALEVRLTTELAELVGPLSAVKVVVVVLIKETVAAVVVLDFLAAVAVAAIQVQIVVDLVAVADLDL